MTLKLVNPGRSEIIETAGIATTVLENHGIEVEAFDHKRNRIGRYIVRDQPPQLVELHVEGCFERAYLMEQGKTIETIRQQTWDPLPPDDKEPYKEEANGQENKSEACEKCGNPNLAQVIGRGSVCLRCRPDLDAAPPQPGRFNS